MKVYKKFMVGVIMMRDKEMYLGHPKENNIYYNTTEVLRLSKWSLMHNMRGLEKVMPGHIAYLAKERKGIRENSIKIAEVKVGDRIIPYSKYMERVLEENLVGVRVSIIRMLRWLH